MNLGPNVKYLASDTQALGPNVKYDVSDTQALGPNVKYCVSDTQTLLAPRASVDAKKKQTRDRGLICSQL